MPDSPPDWLRINPADDDFHEMILVQIITKMREDPKLDFVALLESAEMWYDLDPKEIFILFRLSVKENVDWWRFWEMLERLQQHAPNMAKG